MTTSRYLVKGVRLYLWRSFSEDKRGMVFVLALSVALTAFITISTSRNLEKALGSMPQEALGYIANVYALMFGFTLGFVSSVAVSSIGSILHSDRASRFLEVLLSTPITVGRYIAIITVVSLVEGLVSFSLIALVYTLSLGAVAHQVIRALMLSGWVYMITLLLTVFTSLFNIALFLLATKTSIDISRLSTIPSLALFLFIILARGLGLETLDNRYLHTVVASIALATLALGITIAVMVKKLRGGQIIFSAT